MSSRTITLVQLLSTKASKTTVIWMIEILHRQTQNLWITLLNLEQRQLWFTGYLYPSVVFFLVVLDEPHERIEPYTVLAWTNFFERHSLPFLPVLSPSFPPPTLINNGGNGDRARFCHLRFPPQLSSRQPEMLLESRLQLVCNIHEENHHGEILNATIHLIMWTGALFCSALTIRVARWPLYTKIWFYFTQNTHAHTHIDTHIAHAHKRYFSVLPNCE